MEKTIFTISSLSLYLLMALSATGTAAPSPKGDPATGSTLVLDEVKPGSLGEWKERFDPKSINPQFGCEEFTSPFDRSTALRTWAKGNTFDTCETKWIRRVYATGPQQTDGAAVEAFLAFTFDGTVYNLPSVKLELLDERGQVVAGQVYFGKGIIGSFNRGQLPKTGHRELPSASGLQRFDLAREFGSGLRFSALAVSLMNYACQGENSVVFDHLVLRPGTSTGPTRPSRQVRTGTITTGARTPLASQSIDSSGGTIAVNKPGHPLDGFVIDVPPGSYTDSRTFKVSSAPIANQTFGNDINPISPMIIVDNSGGYSDELIYVRVPVKVPAGYFAMGFLYDEKTKQLEGMPLVGKDAESVTIATRHFSNIFVSMIEKALLKKDIDSHFEPGIDDWQVPNQCSYIAPGGHCTGQSIAAMWYYYAKPDGKEARLYGRYDNNGNRPATPDLWQDDSLAYRFCSTIHMDYRDYGVGATDKWYALAGIGWELENNGWKRIDVPGISNESTWRLFAYSIQASGQPQLVTISSNAGGQHTMICYAVSDNGTLRIADPNYHGRKDRIIEYVEGKFKPYNSGDTQKDIAAGRGKAYEKIVYWGGWTIVPYKKIAGRWSEFKNKTIGNDRFPEVSIKVKDDKGQWLPLVDGFLTSKKMFNPSVAGNFVKKISVYRDGVELPFDNKSQIELKPGKNLLGIYVEGKVGTDWEYVDFKYFNVIYSSLSDAADAEDYLVLQKVEVFQTHQTNVGGLWERTFNIAEGLATGSIHGQDERGKRYSVTVTAKWATPGQVIKFNELDFKIPASVTVELDPANDPNNPLAGNGGSVSCESDPRSPEEGRVLGNGASASGTLKFTGANSFSRYSPIPVDGATPPPEDKIVYTALGVSVLGVDNTVSYRYRIMKLTSSQAAELKEKAAAH